MKSAKFRKVELNIRRRSIAYSSYVITANYKGQNVSVHTHDSEVFDWLDDDSNKELHQWAKRKAYNLIKEMYDIRSMYDSYFNQINV